MTDGFGQNGELLSPRIIKKGESWDKYSLLLKSYFLGARCYQNEHGETVKMFTSRETSQILKITQQTLLRKTRRGLLNLRYKRILQTSLKWTLVRYFYHREDVLRYSKELEERGKYISKWLLGELGGPISTSVLHKMIKTGFLKITPVYINGVLNFPEHQLPFALKRIEYYKKIRATHLTANRIATILNVDPHRIRKLTKKGYISSLKLLGHNFYREDSIEHISSIVVETRRKKI